MGVVGPPGPRERIGAVKSRCLELIVAGVVPVAEGEPSDLVEWHRLLVEELEACEQRVAEVEARWQAGDPELAGPAPLSPAIEAYVKRVEQMMDRAQDSTAPD